MAPPSGQAPGSLTQGLLGRGIGRLHLRIDSLGGRFTVWKISTRGGERWRGRRQTAARRSSRSSFAERVFRLDKSPAATN